MKRVMTTALFFLAIGGFVLPSVGGDKKDDKTLTVGKDGLKVDGKIAEDDKRHEYKITLDGNDLELKLRMKSYKVQLEADKKYTMTANTDDSDFDPLLVVLDAAGKILAYDDDSGGSLNSKLEFTAKKAGVYNIHVAGLRETMGPYTLKIVTAGK